MAFIPLKDLVSESLKRAKINEQVNAVRIFACFEQAVRQKIGEKSLSRLKPVLLKDGVLKISVLSSALSSELKLHENEIIEMINQEFRKKVITKLQFF